MLRSLALVTLFLTFSAQADPFGAGVEGLSFLVCAKDFRSTAVLNHGPAEIAQTGKNIEALSKLSGIDYGRNAESFGNAPIWGAMLEGWTRPFAHDDNAIEFLRRVLARPYRNDDELLRAVSAWTEAAGAGKNIAPDEFVNIVWRRRLSFKPFKSIERNSVIGTNGFIDEAIYAHFGRDHFIGADPHDFASHLVAFANPSFTHTFRRYMAISSEVLLPLKEGPKSESVMKAREVIAELLGGITRDITHENWTYLEKNAAGKTTLFASGGNPFNMVTRLILGDTEEVGAFLLAYRTITQSKKLPPLDLIATLPGIDDFLRVEENSRLYARFRAAAEELSVASAGEISAAAAEANVVAHAIAKRFGPSADFTNPETISDLMEALAKEIQKSPRLSRIYRREARQGFFDASVDLSEHYLQWAKRNIPDFPPSIRPTPALAKSAAYREWTATFSLAEKKAFLRLFNRLRIPESEFIPKLRKLLETVPEPNTLKKLVTLDAEIVRNLLNLTAQIELAPPGLFEKFVHALVSGGSEASPLAEIFRRIDFSPAMYFSYANSEKLGAIGYLVPKNTPLADFLLGDLLRKPELVDRISSRDILTY